MTSRVKMICGRCGSDAVAVDAWAEWSEERQEWQLLDPFEAGFCFDCDKETDVSPVATREGEAA